VSSDHVATNAPGAKSWEIAPVSNETASSEDPGTAVSDVEPAVLSYAQLRNRECLRAWRRRHQEYQAGNGEAASVPLNRSRTAAAVLARAI
jgi:hypothetical protein